MMMMMIVNLGLVAKIACANWWPQTTELASSTSRQLAAAELAHMCVRESLPKMYREPTASI